MTPSISVVIPAFNAECTLERTLDSVFSQTLTPGEVIVIDDGSTDATAEIARKRSVRLIQGPNGGPAHARNTGIRASGAEWIALLDADDVWLPHRLEVQVPYCREEVGVVFSGQESRPLSQDAKPPGFDQLWSRNPILNSSVLLRRKAWESVGGFDEDRKIIGVEDYNLWLRLAHAGWVLQPVPGAVCRYCPTLVSLSRQVERFARAELANVARLETQLTLARDLALRKERELYAEYGRELLHIRDMPRARQYLRRALTMGGGVTVLPYVLAAHLPKPLLDLIRRR